MCTRGDDHRAADLVRVLDRPLDRLLAAEAAVSAQITRYRSVSSSPPGPIAASHEPVRGSPGLCRPAAWAPLVSEWQTRIALSRAGASVP